MGQRSLIWDRRFSYGTEESHMGLNSVIYFNILQNFKILELVPRGSQRLLETPRDSKRLPDSQRLPETPRDPQRPQETPRLSKTHKDSQEFQILSEIPRDSKRLSGNSRDYYVFQRLSETPRDSQTLSLHVEFMKTFWMSYEND